MTRRITLTVGEVCELTGKSERTIQDWCKTGKLDGFKGTKTWTIYKSSVNEYLRAQETKRKANKYAYRRGERKW